MQVEDAEDRDALGSRQRPQPREQLSLHVRHRLRNHRTVQHEKDPVHAARQLWLGALAELAPETFHDFIRHRGAGRGAEVGGREDGPAELLRRCERTAEWGGITGTLHHLRAYPDLEVRKPGGAGEERVGLVEEAGDKNTHRNGELRIANVES